MNELSKIDTVIIKSKGSVPDEIKNIEQNYLSIIQKYNSLFQTTITFLESISENLQQTDEALAQQTQIMEV